jgi:hypothetical protein
MSVLLGHNGYKGSHLLVFMKGLDYKSDTNSVV